MGLMDTLARQPDSYVKKKQYQFEKVLGNGSFGSVKKAVWTRPDTNEPVGVAVKCIMKKSVVGQESVVKDEMDVLHGLDHVNVVKFYDFFESKEKFYLVFELAEGGELFDRICEQGKFTEKDAIGVIKATLAGTQYLHQHNIVHRDLKPENLLYRTGDSSDLVIADFGIAKHLESSDEILTTVCGSPGYAAPEVLNRVGHGKPVDIWSIGIITYTLLCGYTPFRSDDRAELIKETTRAKVEFHARYWANVSQEAKSFILTLLKPDPTERPTVSEALQHKWLNEHKGSTEHDLLTGIRENWSPRAKWRTAIAAVRATNRMKSFASSAHSTLNSSSDEINHQTLMAGNNETRSETPSSILDAPSSHSKLSKEDSEEIAKLSEKVSSVEVS